MQRNGQVPPPRGCSLRARGRTRFHRKNRERSIQDYPKTAVREFSSSYWVKPANIRAARRFLVCRTKWKTRPALVRFSARQEAALAAPPPKPSAPSVRHWSASVGVVGSYAAALAGKLRLPCSFVGWKSAESRFSGPQRSSPPSSSQRDSRRRTPKLPLRALSRGEQLEMSIKSPSEMAGLKNSPASGTGSTIYKGLRVIRTGLSTQDHLPALTQFR